MGDVVAEPVVNEKGRTLLPKGAKLSAAVLSRLVGWGVNRLRIEGDDADEADDAKGDQGSSLHEELEHRFAEWEGDQLMMAIKAIAARHLQQR